MWAWGLASGAGGGEAGQGEESRTVVSPGASLGPGHINIDLSRGWSKEGQREHQALSHDPGIK